MKIGRITASDRVSAGVIEDLSGLAIETGLREIFPDEATQFVVRHSPDEKRELEHLLMELADMERCDLILTTGGVGLTMRDVTPEATRTVLAKELIGFGEMMRLKSFAAIPTSVLWRGTAGVRGRTLIVNLPGSEQSVRECLRGIAPALCECLERLRLRV